jgi:hypothetical protein
MSYRDPGVPYIPPPPPPRRSSPLLYFGIGCGILVLLTAGCMGYFAIQFKNAAVEAMKKPLDKDAALKAMGDAPIYPGAQLNENMTKIQRATMNVLSRMTPASRMEIVAYSTVDSPEQVMAWYDKVMPKKGFEESASGDYSKFGRGTLHKQYRKGNDLMVVQAQQQTRETDNNVLVLIRFYNLRENAK